ncbi:MAG: hypothetical protein E6Q76_14300 [Rhizobium sp.]|nr:MAG: hypothetical protein E6Q76_14300 [Rhizobium sp.]
MTLSDVQLILVFAVALMATRRAPLLYWATNLPGIAAHEVCHWLVALVLFGRPTGVSLLPRKMREGWTLGTVTVRAPRWWNMAPISLAPLALLPISGEAYQLLSSGTALISWPHIGGLYLAATLAVSSLPSSADWRHALSNPLPLVAVLIAACAWLRWRGMI